jgi:hypothetical protein
MSKNLRRRKIIIIISSVIGLILVVAALAVAAILYSNSITLSKLKEQCSELGVGTHAITYRGVSTTLECNANGNMYLPARQFIKAE